MTKKRRDILIKPVNPKPWKMRYFTLRRIANDPSRRHADRTFHGVEGGCFAGRPADPAGSAFTEAMVYVDEDGMFWLPDPYATENQLDGWRMVAPCTVCGTIELDKIIGERLAWQDRGRCYRTYHAGFFRTKEGDGTTKNDPLRAEAIRMCCGNAITKPCPVQRRCAEWGLRLHTIQPVVGILGGLDEIDRREMLSAARSA